MHAHWLVIALALGYFILYACLYLDRPGLYYDETMFVPAALGGQYAQVGFVSASFDGFPTMIMPYVGALKSYLFAPIFALFGVSVATIRLPVIALSAITLLLSYLLGRQFLGRWDSALLILLMATCPSFIFMSKVDWGPIVLPMLLKIAVLIAFFRLLHTSQMRHLWMLGILSLIGLYDKQDFSWVIVAVAVGGVTVYGRQLWDLFMAHRAHTMVALCALAVAGAALAGKVIIPNLGAPGNSSFQNPLPHLLSSWNNYQGVLGEADLLAFFANQGNQPGWMAWSSALVAGALIFLALTRLWAGPLPRQAAIPARAAVFFLVVFVVMLFEIAATKLATGPHHVIELWPFQDMILLGSASAALQTFRLRWTSRTASASNLNKRSSFAQTPWLAALSLFFAGLALCATVATQAVSTIGLEALTQEPAMLRPVFRTDVYRIAGYIDANSSQVDKVIAANWGIGMQLFSLACPDWRGKVYDGLWWQLAGATPQTESSIIRAQLGNQRVLVVVINQQSQYDFPPTLRVDASVFQQEYAAMFPDRHPVTVLATDTYNVIYFGPPNDLQYAPTSDEGCSAHSGLGVGPTSSPAESLSPSISWRLTPDVHAAEMRRRLGEVVALTT